MTPETQNTPKKPYAPPQLRVYGDIKELTQTNQSFPQSRVDHSPHTNRS